MSATPEERIRQQLLHHMMGQLGYPASLLVVEKELTALPHLALNPVQLPSRRADLLCFAKDIAPQQELYPLLLVECKAVPITSRMISQVTGYNHFVKAYFIAIVNGEEMRTGWYDQAQGEYLFVSFLPAYQELLSKTISMK